jgi:hypothetical protein
MYLASTHHSEYRHGSGEARVPSIIRHGRTTEIVIPPGPPGAQPTYLLYPGRKGFEVVVRRILALISQRADPI